jgi:hypothetical protein
MKIEGNILVVHFGRCSTTLPRLDQRNPLFDEIRCQRLPDLVSYQENKS